MGRTARLPRSWSNRVGEPPVLAFDVGEAAVALAVVLVSGLPQHARALGHRPAVVLVDIADLDIHAGGDLAKGRGGLVARRAAHHDHCVAQLHLGVRSRNPNARSSQSIAAGTSS